MLRGRASRLRVTRFYIARHGLLALEVTSHAGASGVAVFPWLARLTRWGERVLDRGDLPDDALRWAKQAAYRWLRRPSRELAFRDGRPVGTRFWLDAT